MKEAECPNCGGNSPTLLSEGEFQCKFCDSIYYDQEILKRKKATDKKIAYAKAEAAQYNARAEQSRTVNKMSRRVLLVVVIGLIVVFGYVGYMAKKSMDQTTKMQENMLKSLQPAK